MKQFTLTYGEMLRVKDILATVPVGSSVIFFRDLLKNKLIVEYSDGGHRVQVVA